jgi:hypothetical protein
MAAFPLLSRASRGSMVQRVATVAFEGIEARAVDVQVQVAPGLPAFKILRIIKLTSGPDVIKRRGHELTDTTTARLFLRAHVYRPTIEGRQPQAAT